MPEIENKLKELGYELPPPRPPGAGNIIPAVRTGNLVFLSGTGPGLPGGGLLHTGKLGGEVTVEQGYDCARQTMLNLLMVLKREIGDLDNVSHIVKLLCHGELHAGLWRHAAGGQRRVGPADQPVRRPGTARPFGRGHGHAARRNADRNRDDRRGRRLGTPRRWHAFGPRRNHRPARPEAAICRRAVSCCVRRTRSWRPLPAWRRAAGRWPSGSTLWQRKARWQAPGR